MDKITAHYYRKISRPALIASMLITILVVGFLLLNDWLGFDINHDLNPESIDVLIIILLICSGTLAYVWFFPRHLQIFTTLGYSLCAVWLGSVYFIGSLVISSLFSAVLINVVIFRGFARKIFSWVIFLGTLAGATDAVINGIITDYEMLVRIFCSTLILLIIYPRLIRLKSFKSEERIDLLLELVLLIIGKFIFLFVVHLITENDTPAFPYLFQIVALGVFYYYKKKKRGFISMELQVSLIAFVALALISDLFATHGIAIIGTPLMLLLTVLMLKPANSIIAHYLIMLLVIIGSINLWGAVNLYPIIMSTGTMMLSFVLLWLMVNKMCVWREKISIKNLYSSQFWFGFVISLLTATVIAIPSLIIENLPLVFAKEMAVGLALSVGIGWMVARSTAINQILKESEQYNRALVVKQNQLFTIMGHELRTPATTIQMILDDDSRDENLINKCSIIKSNIHHLLTVLDDMTYVTHPEKLKKVKLSKTSLCSVIESAIEYTKKICQANKLKVTITYQNDCNSLIFIPEQTIRQIALNLIRNSALHSNATSLYIVLSGSLDKKNFHFRIDFIDNGLEIDNEQELTLFRAFNYERNKKIEVSGLDLYTSHKLAKEELHGNLEYYRNEQGGSTFRLTGLLPLETETETEEKINLIMRKTILFVEDSMTIRLASKNLLEKNGATVLAARDGQEALDLYQKQQPDIVLTDIMMPVMDGYELTEQLRANQFKGPIIGISAAVMGQEADLLVIKGADAVIPKPINIDKLNEILVDLAEKETLA